MLQSTSATFSRVERAGPGERHARSDRPPPSIGWRTGRILAHLARWTSTTSSAASSRSSTEVRYHQISLRMELAGIGRRQPVEARAGVRDDRGQRLVGFMRDRRSQLPQCRRRAAGRSYAGVEVAPAACTGSAN